MKLKPLTVAALVLSLSVGSVPARAQERPQVVNRTEVDQALSAKTQSDDAARASIRELLARDEVRQVANESGLDLKRAESAVSTLQGDELARISERATAANDLLAGAGSGDIHINIIVLLLIVIIVILLVRN
jgi:hypothetical protein